jgi:diguanylate cyclase (GGDEF)-like protein
MAQNNYLIEGKVILIADGDESSYREIKSYLLASGYKKTLWVKDGTELLGKLREFYSRLSDLGLIILSDELPNCQVQDVCLNINRLDEHSRIPLIVMSKSGPAVESACIPTACKDNALEFISTPTNQSELNALVHLSLLLKRERDIRREHEESLIDELSERKVMEARLKYLISHDELTGISNRRSLEKSLELSIHHCKNFNRCGALLYLDLDNFNVINDIEGHETGDKLLISVVRQIRKELAVSQQVARIGADEFCILLEGVDQNQVLDLAERLRTRLDDHHFVTGDNSYHISASIGVAMLKRSSGVTRPSEIISHAHQACYVAKSEGRNKVHLFDKRDTTSHKLHDDVHWVPIIREALSHDRFVLNYQPIVRLSDGEISHYEVLLRMKGEDGELIGPNQFIPVAERMGLIHHLDMWVVEHAIDFLATLSGKEANTCLAINLSTYAFQDGGLLPLIKQKLETTWVSASRLTFEITETAAINNFDRTREMVARIRALGCHFALDDFGAGFSSFNYVKNFPVDYLKIDGQFIQNLVADETDQVLVKAMIDIAKSLGKKTIAEYVEDVETATLLKEFGVDYIQGYLLGKPSRKLINGLGEEAKKVINEIPGTAPLFAD